MFITFKNTKESTASLFKLEAFALPGTLRRVDWQLVADILGHKSLSIQRRILFGLLFDPSKWEW
jgi:hypothetical protein